MKIQKGIEVPNNRVGQKTDFAFQVEKMEVGDCVSLDGVFDRSDNRFNRVRKQMQRLGWKPASKKTPEGYKIWRTQ